MDLITRIFLRCGVDAHHRKKARVEALGAGRIQDDVDAVELDMRGIAEGGEAFAEAHFRIFHEVHDLDDPVDRIAGTGRRFCSEPQAEFPAPSPAAMQICTAIGSQIVPIAVSRARLEPAALRRMTVASPAVPPPGLSHTSAMTTGPNGRPSASATACFSSICGMMKVPRLEKSSRPSSRARVEPLSGLLSLTTSSFVPISGTSPAMKPWTTEMDSISASLFSIVMILSTKERIGSREVGKTSIIRAIEDST